MLNKKTFYGFTSLTLAVMLALLVIPLLFSAWFGLHYMDFSNLNSPVYVGLDNFSAVLNDARFWAALQWTLLIVAVTVPMSMLLGFVMALLVDQLTGWMRSIFVAAYLLPMIIVPVIGAVVFRQLVEPSGIISWIYRVMFDQALILSEGSMKIIILVNTVWLITPFSFIIFFAGLQTLPHELSEAAQIDSANRWQQIRYVVFPHLKTLIVLTGLINVMDMFRIFDNVFVLTGQNPVYNADTVMTYTYRAALDVQQLGLGNAIAVITVIAIMIVLIPFLYLTYREQRSER